MIKKVFDMIKRSKHTDKEFAEEIKQLRIGLGESN